MIDEKALEEAAKAIRDDDNAMPWGSFGNLVKASTQGTASEQQVVADHYALRIAEKAITTYLQHADNALLRECVDDEGLLHIAVKAFEEVQPKEMPFCEEAVQAVIDAIRPYLTKLREKGL